MNPITSMIFFPEKAFFETPEDYGFHSEEVKIPVEKGVSLHGWAVKAPVEKGTILFLHGNAGNISHRLFKIKGWLDRGFSMLMVDYRGFGKSSGQIEHGDDVIKDANAALTWILNTQKLPLSKIILYGESLGTHPAVQLANDHAALGLILEAPFTSFYDLADRHYPFVPKALIKDFEFSNERSIAGIKAPLFILHGTEDEICPYAQAQRLFEKAPEPKEFFTIKEGTHNNLPGLAGIDFWEKPFQFILKYTK